MEEPINKKNIIFLFLTLIVLFLFVYKGFILTGEEYLMEYNSFRAENAKQSQEKLKKGNSQNQDKNKEKSSGSSKKELPPLHKKIFQELQNLEDLKLSLGALDHNIRRNDNQIMASLLKIINGIENNTKTVMISNENTSSTIDINNNFSFSNNTNYLSNSINQLKELINEIETNKERKVDVDNLIDHLSQSINSLRSAVTEKEKEKENN